MVGGRHLLKAGPSGATAGGLGALPLPGLLELSLPVLGFTLCGR